MKILLKTTNPAVSPDVLEKLQSLYNGYDKEWQRVSNNWDDIRMSHENDTDLWDLCWERLKVLSEVFDILGVVGEEN